jgi:pheromone shutdown protein TraB
MIHVGTKEFYEQVRARLASCDLILAEGVDSKKGEVLTKSYTIVRRIKRMDLITQREAMLLKGLKGKIVNADMNGPAFDKGWSGLPFTLRAILPVAASAVASYLLLFGTREIIAEHMGTDDLPSRDEVLNQDEYFDKLDDLIVDERDKVLLNHITRLDQAGSAQKQLVAVLFGAKHMRAVSALLLHRLGYRILQSEWITVLEL